MATPDRPAGASEHPTTSDKGSFLATSTVRTAGLTARRNHGSWHLSAELGQDVVLMPGQMYFGGRAATIRTLLGSCLAITLWHPARRVGGMCHFLLPSRQRRPGEPLDGRYGDEAMEAMMDMLELTGTKPSEYVAHLYGGADTMPEGGGLRFNVGERNIEQGWTLVDRYGFQLEGVDVGEDVPRTVTLTLATGEVDMKRGTGHAPQFATPSMKKSLA
jgi:chemotaxis protein CheD